MELEWELPFYNRSRTTTGNETDKTNSRSQSVQIEMATKRNANSFGHTPNILTVAPLQGSHCSNQTIATGSAISSDKPRAQRQLHRTSTFDNAATCPICLEGRHFSAFGIGVASSRIC
jgi:hypothetical protein